MKIPILLTLALALTAIASGCSVPTITTTVTAALTRTNDTPATRTIETAVSRDKAIAIASQYLTLTLIQQSEVSIQLGERSRLPAQTAPQYVWQVSFSGFSASRDELISAGWQEDGRTIFPDYPGAEYKYAYFNIDAGSGRLLIKAVSVLPGTPPPPDASAVVWIPSERPIEVVSLYRKDNTATTIMPDGRTATSIIPSGPSLQISVKNAGTQAVTRLYVELGISVTKDAPFFFGFNITASSPLEPGETVSAGRFLMMASYGERQYYPVFISGTFQNGSTFGYTQYIAIPKS